jgi:hypothetical protein
LPILSRPGTIVGIIGMPIGGSSGHVIKKHERDRFKIMENPEKRQAVNEQKSNHVPREITADSSENDSRTSIISNRNHQAIMMDMEMHH